MLGCNKYWLGFCNIQGKLILFKPSHFQVSSYRCVCQTGYYGNRCQYHTNECRPNPCVHGVCTDLDNDYRCDCQVNWTGKNCSIAATNIPGSNCNHNRCQHGSTCLSLANSQFKCNCLPGFSGAFCELDIDECLKKPCKNNAVCIDRVAGFQCACPAGFDGHLCERNKDDCLARPCKNRASCVDGIDSFKCLCRPGYTGVNCTYDIDDCRNVNCRNGAACVDLVNDFQCKCRWELISILFNSSIHNSIQYLYMGITNMVVWPYRTKKK